MNVVLSIIIAASTVFLFEISFTTSCEAADFGLQEIKLEWGKPQLKSLKSSNPSSKDSLSRQKYYEDNKKWLECTAEAKKNIKKFKEIEPWILASWARCASALAGKLESPKPIYEILAHVGQLQIDLFTGPWSKLLLTDICRLRIQAVELGWKTNASAAWKQLEEIFKISNLVDKDMMAKANCLGGEISQSKGLLKSAKTLFEQALAMNETKSCRDRLNSVLLALNENQEAGAEKNGKLAFIQDEEVKLDEQMKTVLNSGDWLGFLEAAVDYLQKYPTGRESKWTQEKIREVYLNFFDKSDDEKYFILRERALEIFLKADFQLVTEWAKLFHRRGDYKGAMRLAEKAIQQSSNSSFNAINLYIAGRSAQFTGEYMKALNFFGEYLRRHSGAEDVVEVLFRTALIHLRLAQYSTAIADLERLLTLRGTDRYELSSRYWLVRALQATQNSRANEEIDVILAKYPFSYYGLKLRAEKQNGVLEWPTSLKIDKGVKDIWLLTGAQKKTWDRIRILVSHEWMQEAYQEILWLPTPTNMELKLLLGQEWAQAQAFPTVLKLINEVGDVKPELRSLDVMNLVLPNIFAAAIEVRAQEQKLSPILVRSLIRQESAFGVKAVSSSNAMGLMQLIPPTAQEVAQELGIKKLEIPEDVFNKDTNIQMGTYYLAKMIKKYGGNVTMGLAAYNAGPKRLEYFVKGRVEVQNQMQKHSSHYWDEIWFDELPWFETCYYVKAILRNIILYKIHGSAQKNSPEERRVQFQPVLWSDLVL